MARDKDPEVYRISGARQPLSQDIDARTKRYLWSMGIRTLCFIGCVIAFTVFKQPVVGFVLLGGSLLLPYMAVVIANAKPLGPGIAPPEATLRSAGQELGSAPPSDPGADGAGAGEQPKA